MKSVLILVSIVFAALVGSTTPAHAAYDSEVIQSLANASATLADIERYLADRDNWNGSAANRLTEVTTTLSQAQTQLIANHARHAGAIVGIAAQFNQVNAAVFELVRYLDNSSGWDGTAGARINTIISEIGTIESEIAALHE